VEPENLLPKRLVQYIHEIGVRSLDHLTEHISKAGTDQTPDGVHTLVDYWKSLPATEKQKFVERVAHSVVEVVAASAALPMGLKLGKKAVKATRKVLKRKTKRLRKIARHALAKRTAVRTKSAERTEAKKREAAKNGKSEKSPAKVSRKKKDDGADLEKKSKKDKRTPSTGKKKR